jgi:nicotinate-nucleotide adenylyltransferase
VSPAVRPLAAGQLAAVRAQTSGAWGLLGGTFDPVHYAHLAIAEAAADILELSGVLFMPAGLPPHKPERIVTPPSHRVAMVQLAIEGNERFRLSRLEVDRPGSSYAVETVARLVAEPLDEAAARHGYVFILSVEALAGLHRWREPQRLLELCRIAVLPRLGHRAPGREWLAEHFPGQEDRVLFLDGPDLGHSASQIRRLAAQGRSIRYLVPDSVAAYIREHDLYPPELWQKN